MTDTLLLAAPSCSSLAAGESWARPMLDRQLQVLGELAEIGLELARAVEADSRGPDADLDKSMLAYSRVARAVRQTLMLQARLIEALQAAEAGEVEKARLLEARRTKVKDGAKRILRGVIRTEHEVPERIERLCAEAAERLDADVHGDLLVRPVREVIAAICRDLGLDPRWPDLEDEIIDLQAMAQGEEPDEDDDNGPIEVVWLDGSRPRSRPNSS